MKTSLDEMIALAGPLAKTLDEKLRVARSIKA
jgi:hypothetical protein